VAAVLVAGHIYLALIHPPTRPALRGITRGSVRREWAEHHHGEWVAAMDARDE
jgi:formate dehydrogenase subunit gamma